MQQELLARFKRSIGIVIDDDGLDEIYSEWLLQSTALLAAEDIADDVLESELGQSAVILVAKSLMNNEDIVDNKTITLMRCALANQSKTTRGDA